MQTMPSVKGSVLALDVQAVLKLLAAGKVSKDELSHRLEPSDLKILDHPVNLSSWYDIRIIARLLKLLHDVEGDGSHAYLLQHGADAADRLLEAGLYHQLEYLGRAKIQDGGDAHDRFLAFGRDLRLLMTLSGSLYNFGRWQAKLDPQHEDRYVIEITEASAFPEELCRTTQGFINRMARKMNLDDLWRCERVRPDLVVYRMIRSL